MAFTVTKPPWASESQYPLLIFLIIFFYHYYQSPSKFLFLLETYKYWYYQRVSSWFFALLILLSIVMVSALLLSTTSLSDPDLMSGLPVIFTWLALRPLKGHTANDYSPANFLLLLCTSPVVKGICRHPPWKLCPV